MARHAVGRGPNSGNSPIDEGGSREADSTRLVRSCGGNTKLKLTTATSMADPIPPPDPGRRPADWAFIRYHTKYALISRLNEQIKLYTSLPESRDWNYFILQNRNLSETEWTAVVIREVLATVNHDPPVSTNKFIVVDHVARIKKYALRHVNSIVDSWITEKFRQPRDWIFSGQETAFVRRCDAFFELFCDRILDPAAWLKLAHAYVQHYPFETFQELPFQRAFTMVDSPFDDIYNMVDNMVAAEKYPMIVYHFDTFEFLRPFFRFFQGEELMGLIPGWTFHYDELHHPDPRVYDPEEGEIGEARIAGPRAGHIMEE